MLLSIAFHGTLSGSTWNSILHCRLRLRGGATLRRNPINCNLSAGWSQEFSMLLWCMVRYYQWGVIQVISPVAICRNPTEVIIGERHKSPLPCHLLYYSASCRAFASILLVPAFRGIFFISLFIRAHVRQRRKCQERILDRMEYMFMCILQLRALVFLRFN